MMRIAIMIMMMRIVMMNVAIQQIALCVPACSVRTTLVCTQ